jgi:POT family proton-dependent oligopeptide transporter
MNQDEKASANRWPPQIKYIVGNEAAERFSYYGMKSILALYITASLMQTKDRATTIIHLAGFAVYFMPLFGAWLSDRMWGRYKTILYISLFYCAGHGVLAMSELFRTVDAKLTCLYIGLGLIALGAGGIKPCVSAFMGDQFGPEQSHLMRKAYGAFYFSINFGSFFSFLIIPWIAATPPAELPANAGAIGRLLWQIKHAGFTGYGWAFGVPGILMGLATLVFWLGTRYYVRKPAARETKAPGYFKVFFAALKNSRNVNPSARGWGLVSLLTGAVLPVIMMIAMVYVALQHIEPAPVPIGQAGNLLSQNASNVPLTVQVVGWTAIGCFGLWYLLVVGASLRGRIELPDAFWNCARTSFKDHDIAAARTVTPVLAVFALVPAFWALFEQSNSTWVLQGEKMVPFSVCGFEVGAEQMQSLNPLLVMILVPVLTWGLYPLIEKMGLRVTQLRRMSLGLALTSLSYVLVSWLQHRLEIGETLSLTSQIAPYIVLTTGEVLISTTGLEFAYTQASALMKSTIMSFWFLSIAIGNLLVTTITQLGGGHGDESVSAKRFLIYAGITAVVTVLFVVVSTRYRYRDQSTSNVPTTG